MKQKGQGTIEYLVIIAIVIVIALVVVGLLLQVMNSGSGVPETQARATWKSSQPLAITDWGFNSGGTILTLVIRNNDAETISYRDFNLNTTDSNYSPTDIAPGSTLNVEVTVTTSCTSGNKYSYPKENIQFDYNTVNISGKTQKALADIVGTC